MREEAGPCCYAERDAKGDGRVYTIAFEAADADGATCTGEVTVAVPRHK